MVSFCFNSDQIRAKTQPKKLQPKNKLRTKIAAKFECFLYFAIRVGKKYDNNDNNAIIVIKVILIAGLNMENGLYEDCSIITEEL